MATGYEGEPGGWVRAGGVGQVMRRRDESGREWLDGEERP